MTAFGSLIDLTAKPKNVDDHLRHVEKQLERSVYREYSNGGIRRYREKIGAAPSDSLQFEKFQRKLIDQFKIRNQSCNADFSNAIRRLEGFVDSQQLPKKIAWHFGILFGRYAACNYGKLLLANEDLKKMSLEEKNDLALRKPMIFFKTSLLLFSYYFGMKDRCPDFLNLEMMDDLLQHPQLISSIESSFEEVCRQLNPQQWSRLIADLDDFEFVIICKCFHSTLRNILQLTNISNPYSMELYILLAEKLCVINAQTLLAVQTNPNFDLTAINLLLIKVYLDLKEWVKRKVSYDVNLNQTISCLIADLQERCRPLIPESTRIEEVNSFEEVKKICLYQRTRILHRTSKTNVERGKELSAEFDYSPFELKSQQVTFGQFLSDKRASAQKWRSTYRHSDIHCNQIYNYLCGYSRLGDLTITTENAAEYLKAVKLFDLILALLNSHHPYKIYFSRSTFDIRKKILELCLNLKSYEAFTMTLNPQKMREDQYLADPRSWISESAAYRTASSVNQLICSQTLSNQMSISPLGRRLIAARGIAGAGKSRYLKIFLLQLRQSFSPHSPENFLVKGILNPDFMKAFLKRHRGKNFNTQIHQEVSASFKHLFKVIMSKGWYFILDKRNLTLDDVIINLLDPAKKHGFLASLIDFDVRLRTSVRRVLTRPPLGDEPCPELESLIDGFKQARKHRAAIIQLVQKEEAIAGYELYATSRSHLIAEKINTVFHIYYPSVYKQCLSVPQDKDIEEELQQVISDEYITNAIEEGDITEEQRSFLEKWKGMHLIDALKIHISGKAAEPENDLYGKVEIKPFNGTSWLRDFPKLIEHLDSEHLLHIRGSDENGQGLHWEADKFQWSLNSKFNPEAKAPANARGGFQMKVGYFIIPPKHLELFDSKSLSREILNELHVRNSQGELLGFRFFVHPEAYDHFTPLHSAQIPFVKSENSEFMGTPTSSYRSWLLRRISHVQEKTLPFIVKMGVSNSAEDIKRLLPSQDIIKSIRLQKLFDQMVLRSDFVLFHETLGMILSNVSNYPLGTVDSGNIIRELPKELLEGKCQILSFSAVMSAEKVKPENRGVCALNPEDERMKPLPLIYEIMDNAIRKGLVKSSKEFFQRYFIQGYLEAIEPVLIESGISLAQHGQNLCLVLNPDHTLRGFAYRDLEGVSLKRNFIRSYSYDYRYHIAIKILNVITKTETEGVPPPLGAPIQGGNQEKLSERSTHFYLVQTLEKEGKIQSQALEVLRRLSITTAEYHELLKQLDSAYLDQLRKYFDVDRSGIVLQDGTLPAAEKGSVGEAGLHFADAKLWQQRHSLPSHLANLK